MFFSTALAWGSGPTYIPVVKGQFYTGQYYFDGTKSALGGNAGVSFVPALRYSHRFSLIPTVESFYRGTRSAQELADGSTLFQDTWENKASLKAVHGLGPRLRLKEFAGVSMKWLRETADEKWNKGLYDYRIYDGGVEIEHQWSRSLSVAAMYDFSYTRFPNYESLESGQGSDLAREYAGKNVLDTRSHLLSLRAVTPFLFRIRNSVQFYYSPRSYADQHVVQLTGLLGAGTRDDTAYGGELSLERPFRAGSLGTLVPSVRYAHSRLNSTQNHYDAKQTVFIGNFYDYRQNQVGTGLAFAFGHLPAGPMAVETSFNYSKRIYFDRPIQSNSGSYMTDKLYVVETTASVAFSYPLGKTLHLRASSAFGRSRSNNDYEQLYRYNYSNANYLFGFVFDY